MLLITYVRNKNTLELCLYFNVICHEHLVTGGRVLSHFMISVVRKHQQSLWDFCRLQSMEDLLGIADQL